MPRFPHISLYLLATLVACGTKDATTTDSTAARSTSDTVNSVRGTANSVTSKADLQAVAANLVKAAMVKRGDRVNISGGVRDTALMEDVAVEAMKAGAQPVIQLVSERLYRRS